MLCKLMITKITGYFKITLHLIVSESLQKANNRLRPLSSQLKLEMKNQKIFIVTRIEKGVCSVTYMELTSPRLIW